MKTGGGQWIMAIIVGGALLAMLLQAAFSIPGWAATSRANSDKPSQRSVRPSKSSTEELGLGLMGVRADRLARQQIAAAACRAICSRSRSSRSIWWSC